MVEVAQLAERLDYHSLWFSDHVLMTRSSDSGHPANWSGERAYPGDAYMLDGLVSMGAVAAATTRIRFSPSVLISPYRHPLHDARQLAAADIISGGRLIAGVGAGWMKEEFDALGLPFEARGRMLEECVEIYLKSWHDEWVDYDGEFYRFKDVSMNPKPIQENVPIVFGAATKAGARRAAKWGSGLYLLFLDPYPDPTRYNKLHDELLRQLDDLGRNGDEFEFSVMVSARPTDAGAPESKAATRKALTGTPDQVLTDMEAFAEAGYSRCVVHLDVQSGTYDEYLELVERFGDIIPEAKKIPVRAPAL
ncbi:TIGR03619 family F420-dependent LLM class oxidoreductase [Nocardioides pyridinolyticus]